MDSKISCVFRREKKGSVKRFVVSTYFLALPLSEETLTSFRQAAPRWSLFINREPYLDLISYENSFYLAKQVPSFPMTLDAWEALVVHVMSLLKTIFSLSSIESLQFLSCKPQTWVQEML